MRQLIQSLLLVLLVEVLWIRLETNGWYSPGVYERKATKLSMGFPLPGVTFTIHRTTGHMPPFMNYPERSEWLPGLNLSPLLLAVDGLAAVALFLGLRWLISRHAARVVLLGAVLGAGLGILVNLGTRQPTGTSGADPITWFNGLIVVLLLPAAICILAKRWPSWWQPLLLLAAALAVAPWVDLWCDQFRPELHPSAGISGRKIRQAFFEETVMIPLMVGIFITPIVLLARRLVPILRQHKRRPEPIA